MKQPGVPITITFLWTLFFLSFLKICRRNRGGKRRQRREMPTTTTLTTTTMQNSRKRSHLSSQKKIYDGVLANAGSRGAAAHDMLHWGKFDNKTNATKALMDDGKEAWTFEDVQYAQGPDGIAAWYKRDKKKMIEETNALANIPYLVDHEEKKTIVHFQASSLRISGGKTLTLTKRASTRPVRGNAQIAMEVFDLRNTVRQLVYKFPNSVRSAEEFEKQLPEHLSAR